VYTLEENLLPPLFLRPHRCSGSRAHTAANIIHSQWPHFQEDNAAIHTEHLKNGLMNNMTPNMRLMHETKHNRTGT